MSTFENFVDNFNTEIDSDDGCFQLGSGSGFVRDENNLTKVFE